MSTTLSTQAMVTMLNRKTGLAVPDGIDFLNEAFRKINQSQKGGFIWQFKQTTLLIPGAYADIPLPVDFDPGKTAILRGDGTVSYLNTIIPYMLMKDWVNEQHYQTTQPGGFTAWTFFPTFTNPVSYVYKMKLGPPGAFTGVIASMDFFYHALNYAPVPSGPANYFPTPDQFDNLIVDLAVAEVRNVYRMSGQADEVQKAMAAINEIIDTYRTDRYDLAGLTDQVAQAQEKQVEKAK